MEYEFLVDDVLTKVRLEKKGNKFFITSKEQAREVAVYNVAPHTISIVLEGRCHQVFAAQKGEKTYVKVSGRQFVVQEPGVESEDYSRGDDRSFEGKEMVKAPMPGKVIKVCVSEKDNVRKNQTLAIVEAMKMENEIKSSIEGTVKKIHVSEGDLVDAENPLLELKKT